MIGTATKKAERALQRAEIALFAMRSAADNSSFAEAWDDFVHHIARMEEKLKTGARTHPKSRQWYGGIERKRKKDPLLQYIHQARNSEQHGLEDSLNMSFGIGAVGTVHINKMIFHGDKVVHSDWSPATQGAKPILFRSRELTTVKDDRFNTSFDPPNSHLEKPISDNSPTAVASLALEYYRKVVMHAKNLVV